MPWVLSGAVVPVELCRPRIGSPWYLWGPQYLRGQQVSARSRRRRRRRNCVRGRLIQEIAVSIDVRREVEGVLSGEPFSQLGVAPLQRFDNLQVIDD